MRKLMLLFYSVLGICLGLSPVIELPTSVNLVALLVLSAVAGALNGLVMYFEIGGEEQIKMLKRDVPKYLLLGAVIGSVLSLILSFVM